MSSSGILSGGVRRVRLAEWARQQGISRLTAYRMVQRGILPVPCEQSPTGRWYVLVAEGKSVIYARAKRGPHQVEEINSQVSALAKWAAYREVPVFTVVSEIADPPAQPMPRLERLLADRQITQILIESPSVVGDCQYRLIMSALYPHGRAIFAANPSPEAAASSP